MPARATGRCALPPSMLAPGAYRWHVVLTESGTYRPVAKGVTTFTVSRERVQDLDERKAMKSVSRV